MSAHFNLADFFVSDTAAREGIDNTTNDPRILANLDRVMALLELIRATNGNKPIVVSSGYRCLAVNRAIGSDDTSAHVQGLAADIKCPGMTPRALAEAIVAMGLPIDQIIYEFDSWVHVGLRDGIQRLQVMTKRKGTPYMKGII